MIHYFLSITLYLLDPRFTFLRNGATFQLTWSLLEKNYKSCTGNVMHHSCNVYRAALMRYLSFWSFQQSASRDNNNCYRCHCFWFFHSCRKGKWYIELEQWWTINNVEQWWYNAGVQHWNNFESTLHNVDTTVFQRCTTSLQRCFNVSPASVKENYYETERGRRARASDREQEWEQESDFL